MPKTTQGQGDSERRFGPNPCKHGGYQVLCRECDQEELDIHQRCMHCGDYSDECQCAGGYDV